MLVEETIKVNLHDDLDNPKIIQLGMSLIENKKT